MDSREYRFIAVRQNDVPYRIHAGCRWFTPEKARAHWFASEYPNKRFQRECQLKVKLIEQTAMARGWK
jgi:hypothetical protein